MKAHSKLIAAVVGALASVGVSLGLPESLATPEMQAALVTIITGAFVYFAPANEPSA